MQSSMKVVLRNAGAENAANSGRHRSLSLLAGSEPSVQLPIALRVKGLGKSYDQTKAVVDLLRSSRILTVQFCGIDIAPSMN